MAKKLPPVHPGEILKTEFMEPLGLSANALAGALGVPANRVTAIVNQNRSITGDTALRLSGYFTNSARFWMNLQAKYDLDVAEDANGPEIAKTVKPAA